MKNTWYLLFNHRYGCSIYQYLSRGTQETRGRRIMQLAAMLGIGVDVSGEVIRAHSSPLSSYYCTYYSRASYIIISYLTANVFCTSKYLVPGTSFFVFVVTRLLQLNCSLLLLWLYVRVPGVYYITLWFVFGIHTCILVHT